MRIRKLVVALVAATLPLGGTVACARGSYEDCEVSDQEARESDCGYWTLNGVNRSGGQPGADWVWVFFTWVDLGRASRPHKDWKPPKGTNPPREDSDRSSTRKKSTTGTSGSTATTPKKNDPKKAKDTSSVGDSKKTTTSKKK